MNKRTFSNSTALAACVLLATSLATPATAAPVSGSLAAAPVNQLVTRDGKLSITTDSKDVKLVSQLTTKEGVSAVWSVNGEPISVAATSAATVKVVQKKTANGAGTSVEVSVNGDAALQDGPISPDTVASMAKRAGLPAPRVDALRAQAAPAAADKPASRPIGSTIQSACARAGDVGGGQKYAEVCSIQTYMGTSSGYSYVGDEATGTARWNDVWSDLEGFTGAVTYPAGRERIKWNPSTTEVRGSCTNRTYNLTYRGVGLTSSTVVCPEKIVPEIGIGKMAVRWAGDANDPTGIAFTNVIKKRVGLSNNFKVTLYYYHAS